MSESKTPEIETQLHVLMKRALTGADAFDVLRAAYEDLEKFARQTVPSEEAAAIARAIAGNLLTVAQVRRQPVSTCDPLFQRVVELGFRDAEDRLLQVGAYARYCVERGHGSSIEQHLSNALCEARTFFDPVKLTPFEELLDKIRSNANRT